MPVTYKIDKANGIICTGCTGLITTEGVIEHFRLLEQDPDCPDVVKVLLDLTEETSVPTSDNLMEATQESTIRDKVQFGICAIVAGTDVPSGLLRIFEVFADEYFRESHSFRTRSQAEEWLASQHPAILAAG
jgi:hypothetical protein